MNSLGQPAPPGPGPRAHTSLRQAAHAQGSELVSQELAEGRPADGPSWGTCRVGAAEARADPLLRPPAVSGARCQWSRPCLSLTPGVWARERAEGEKNSLFHLHRTTARMDLETQIFLSLKRCTITEYQLLAKTVLNAHKSGNKEKRRRSHGACCPVFSVSQSPGETLSVFSPELLRTHTGRAQGPSFHPRRCHASPGPGSPLPL